MWPPHSSTQFPALYWTRIMKWCSPWEHWGHNWEENNNIAAEMIMYSCRHLWCLLSCRSDHRVEHASDSWYWVQLYRLSSGWWSSVTWVSGFVSIVGNLYEQNLTEIIMCLCRSEQLDILIIAENWSIVTRDQCSHDNMSRMMKLLQLPASCSQSSQRCMIVSRVSWSAWRVMITLNNRNWGELLEAGCSDPCMWGSKCPRLNYNNSGEPMIML